MSPFTVSDLGWLFVVHHLNSSSLNRPYAGACPECADLLQTMNYQQILLSFVYKGHCTMHIHRSGRQSITEGTNGNIKY